MKARAIITTRFDGRGYRPRTVERIQAYTVDSAMDTDSDSWSVEIGDPDEQLLATLRRDSEVRVSLFAVTSSLQILHTGFADQISMSEDGNIVIEGRDITAAAVDSIAEPGRWRWARPEKLIAQQARMLKIGDRLDLDPAFPQKDIYTDGSETYWEFWYRFYRKRACWLWAEPDGLIRAGKLNYNLAPSYKFGSAVGMKSSVSKQGWIPVESVTITKSTQKRVYEVWMIGHHGTIPFIVKDADYTIKDWVKKPRKILESSKVKSRKEALQEIWEEIHETKVGSLEISMVVFNPGFIIRQNRIALVNIPKMGLTGEFFVVGAKTIGQSGSGVYQEVRLREKQYAISRRVPDDPKVAADPQQQTATSMGANLGLPRSGWADFFIQATQKYKGAWDFNYFLAILLAICDTESSFGNVREGGNKEWYPQPKTGTAISDETAITIDGMPVQGIRDATPAEVQEEVRKWKKLFANKDGNPLNPYNREAGVGPMQLTTAGYKVWADEMAGKKGEYDGGRWQPKFNIFAGARAFASKLEGVPTGDVNNIWEGVRAYNGVGPAANAYMREIKKAVEDTWLPAVKSARQSAQQQNQSTSDLPTDSKELRQEFLNHPQITFQDESLRQQVQSGKVADIVLQGVLYFVNNYRFNQSDTKMKFTVSVSSIYRPGDKGSDHATGHAIDLGHYNRAMAMGSMTWLKAHQMDIGFYQMIGPVEYLCIPNDTGYYDRKTLNDHKDHIHLGWPSA